MTVPVAPVTFTASIASGSTTVFPYGFMIADDEDIAVTLDGVLQISGYTVSGAGNPAGGDVTFLVAPPVGTKVVRYLAPIIKRETDYQQFGDWTAAVVNPDFDRVWLAMQALDQKTSRSLKLPIDTEANQEITEDAAARANKCIKFDALGNMTVSLFDPDEAQQSGADALAAAAAAEATATAAAASAEISAALAANSAAGTLPVADQIHGADSKVAPAGLDEICIADSAASYAIKKLTISSLMDLVWSSLGGLIGSGTGKAAPVDADYIPLMDSSASGATKSLSWGNLKSSLKAYFDTVYIAVSQASASEINNESPVAKYISPDRLGSSKRAAKAWVNFDGTLTGTITPRANFNVSSVTKNGTGDYTLNFTSAMADTNYVLAGSAQSAPTGAVVIEKKQGGVLTTSSVQILADMYSAGAFDTASVGAVIFGN